MKKLFQTTLAALSVAAVLGMSAAAANGKDSYSSYTGKGVREQATSLQSFDSLTAAKWSFGTENAAATLDTADKKQGSASLSVKSSRDGWVTAMSANSAFTVDASDKKRTFLKLWIYVNDIGLLEADKSGDSYSDQGTIFLNIHSGAGSHQWNHTITGSGWQEIELSFCNSNNLPESLAQVNYARLSTLSLRYVAKAGLVVKLDDLRVVKYSSDYKATAAPYNGELISNCDYDEFGGAVIGEWYGASFDLSDKKEGSSSLRIEGNASSNEYRLYIGDLNIPMDYDRDVLCFWLYINDTGLVGTSGWTIELNEVQDTHEYQCDFLTVIMSNSISNGWNQIRIPLSQMQKNMDAKFGDTVTLKAFRLVAPGTSNTRNYVIKVDQIYLADKAALPAVTTAASSATTASAGSAGGTTSRTAGGGTTTRGNAAGTTARTGGQSAEDTASQATGEATDTDGTAETLESGASEALTSPTQPTAGDGSLWANPVLYIVAALVLAGVGMAGFFLWKKRKTGAPGEPPPADSP